jgi:hypothetical protein
VSIFFFTLSTLNANIYSVIWKFDVCITQFVCCIICFAFPLFIYFFSIVMFVEEVMNSALSFFFFSSFITVLST